MLHDHSKRKILSGCVPFKTLPLVILPQIFSFPEIILDQRILLPPSTASLKYIIRELRRRNSSSSGGGGGGGSSSSSSSGGGGGGGGGGGQQYLANHSMQILTSTVTRVPHYLSVGIIHPLIQWCFSRIFTFQEIFLLIYSHSYIGIFCLMHPITDLNHRLSLWIQNPISDCFATRNV